MATKPVSDQQLVNTDSEVAVDFIRCFKACLDQDDFYQRYSDEELADMGVSVDVTDNREAFGAVATLWKVANGLDVQATPYTFLEKLYLLVGKPTSANMS